MIATLIKHSKLLMRVCRFMLLPLNQVKKVIAECKTELLHLIGFIRLFRKILPPKWGTDLLYFEIKLPLGINLAPIPAANCSPALSCRLDTALD
jgi:hypothetical protein